MSESLRELEVRRSTLLAAISALHDMRPGSIVGAIRRCGKPTCQLSEELVEVSEHVCRLRPVEEVLTPQEKKRRKSSSKKSWAN